MRPSEPVLATEPLVAAFTRLRQRGARAEVVIDLTGRPLGVLTQENIAEMMMVENARPGWRFRRR
jgi:CBS domain containing-hemolysin-like protein